MKIDTSKEYILCAAVLKRTSDLLHWSDGDIYDVELGLTHSDIYERHAGGLKEYPGAMGFMTSHGRFVDRWEAMEIAYNCGQVSKHTALDKSWHENNINIYGPGGKVINTKNLDNHKFNMLFSEDLYK